MIVKVTVLNVKLNQCQLRTKFELHINAILIKVKKVKIYQDQNVTWSKKVKVKVRQGHSNQCKRCQDHS